jgi:hypothetical protein
MEILRTADMLRGSGGAGVAAAESRSCGFSSEVWEAEFMWFVYGIRVLGRWAGSFFAVVD